MNTGKALITNIRFPILSDERGCSVLSSLFLFYQNKLHVFKTFPIQFTGNEISVSRQYLIDTINKN